MVLLEDDSETFSAFAVPVVPSAHETSPLRALRNHSVHVIHTVREEREEWALVLSVLTVMILVDMLVLRRLKGGIGISLMPLYYFGVAGAYGYHYITRDGWEAGSEWILGFWIEVVLSFDCLYYFHLIIKAFRVPENQIHSVVFLGMPVALLLRLVLFSFVGRAIQSIPFLKIVLGVFLIYSGIHTLYEDSEEHSSSEDRQVESRLVVFLADAFGSRQYFNYDPDGSSLFVYSEDGRLCVTLLGPVLLAVELADVVFALDSFVAKATHMENMQAAFSSSAFAMWAVRSLYFHLCDMLEYFDHLKYGFCAILVFMGFETLVSDIWHPMDQMALCAVVLVLFGTSIISSLVASAFQSESEETDQPRSPTEVRRVSKLVLRGAATRRSTRLTAVLHADLIESFPNRLMTKTKPPEPVPENGTASGARSEGVTSSDGVL